MLLLHGRDDDICPLSQSYPAYNSLKTRKVPTGFFFFLTRKIIKKLEVPFLFTRILECGGGLLLLLASSSRLCLLEPVDR